MTKEQIIQTTNSFFIGKLDFEASQIYPDAELRRDLGISSVDAVAIASFVQKTFGCAIVMAEIKAIITIQDLYDYIENHQG
ncbi:MAG: acyl carrier protein [Paludibacteraceae bacterium]|nr:acyl carrier protein [Paludibacteraceae bacterium]